jgi:hypothetical protein
MLRQDQLGPPPGRISYALPRFRYDHGERKGEEGRGSRGGVGGGGSGDGYGGGEIFLAGFLFQANKKKKEDALEGHVPIHGLGRSLFRKQGYVLSTMTKEGSLS